MRLSKINKLMKQSQQNLQNLSSQYLPHFSGGYDYDPTIIGRVDWLKYQQPRMYALTKQDESIQARSIQQFQTQIETMRSHSDQALEFIKLQNNEKLTKLLKNVKGNNVDEKIFRALEYDLNSFIHINDEE